MAAPGAGPLVFVGVGGWLAAIPPPPPKAAWRGQAPPQPRRAGWVQAKAARLLNMTPR